MADPKYLRSIAVWPEAIMPVLCTVDVHHLPDLLQRLFTPTPSRGIAKLNVRFVPEEASPVLEDTAGVATITWSFDTARFPQLSATKQRGYYLQQLRDALRFAADRYGWDTIRLDSCCAQIRNDDFKAQWWWPAKPKFNPTRQMSAQVFIQMAARTRAWVVFRQRSGAEQARVLLTDFGPGAVTGALDYALGDLSWTNDTTVRVRHENQRDYWAVSTSGEIEFVFPLAESGDAQGLYQLAMLHWEGRYVTRDRKQAMQLMQRAVSLGDKHAQRFIERNQQ
jgi:TPR repeat protein